MDTISAAAPEAAETEAVRPGQARGFLGELGRRIGSSVLALCALIVFVFISARLTGNAASLYLGDGATDEMIKDYEHLNGLDRPLIVQFGSYISDALHGDFGQSRLYNEPAMHVALSRFPNTLVLAVLTLVLGLAIGSILGSLAAYREGKKTDKVITTFSSLALSVPGFWLALILILVFVLRLGWLPSTGMNGWKTFVMPVMTLAIANLGVMVQVVRDSLVGILHTDYVLAATAKGLRPRQVVVRHAWRNASIPVITIAGTTAVGIINGALIVETVFGWPGIGKVIVDSVINRDFALLQAAILVVGFAVVVFNALIDVSYLILDPRVRVNHD